MCSPSRSPLLPPSPPHPSGSSLLPSPRTLLPFKNYTSLYMLWNLSINCMFFLECSSSFFYLAISCLSFISHFKYILSVQVEKEMANHSSTLAWRIPRTEEPGGLQSMGSQRVGHNCATNLVSRKNSEPAREARH